MPRMLAASLAIALAVGTASPAFAANPSPTWDNLVEVKSPRLDLVYLAPGADFRTYTKVMLDPTEVAFRKNFVRDYNSTATIDLNDRMSDSDVARMTDEARKGFEAVFRETWEKAGYQVVTAAGPDVLRVRTAVLDLYVTAPDLRSPQHSMTFSQDAGEATLVLEARDSVTGAILGRAVDKRTVGDMRGMRSSVSNRADFERTFRTWAERSAEGLGELKARSPLDVAATAAK
jgi:hypothetical protein